MKLLRNREIQIVLILYAALTALLVFAVSFANIPDPLVIIVGGMLYASIYLGYTHRRYHAIDQLSTAIDRILHGQEQVLISANEEGELSILQNEIHKMTLRLKEAADALQADKLQLVDAIADISHQLRTPLTSMNLTLSLLTADDLSDERRLSLTHDLRKSLRRIDWLIEALLKLSRIDAGAVQFKSEPVAVHSLIEMAVEPIAVTLDLKDISLAADVQDVSFAVDLSWTAEAIGNILKNCSEHTPIGGRIEITASETPLYTEIIVQDNGKGFSKEDLPHLFDRFYKGKNASAESIGIGLALARTIIARQNGTLQASNRKDGGAQFTIRFYKGII